MPKDNASAGFTLVEVLVALLVLSIGLVSLAALQLTSLQRAQASYHISLVTTAALDFEERAWIVLASRPTPLCLDAAEVNGIGQAVQALWRSDGPSTQAGVPGLTVTADRGNPTSEFLPVTITFQWGQIDTRVEPETFVYSFRALCRPPPPAT